MLSLGKTEVERVEVVEEPSSVTVQHGQMWLMGIMAPFSVHELVGKDVVAQGMQPVVVTAVLTQLALEFFYLCLKRSYGS